MKKFHEKQYGRIFTDKEQSIKRIKSVIKKMDGFEYDYLPDNLITVFNGAFDCVYNSKFYALDLDALVENYMENGIVCGYVVARVKYNEYNGDPLTEIEQPTIDNCIKQFYLGGFWTKDQVFKHYGLEYLNN